MPGLLSREEARDRFFEDAPLANPRVACGGFRAKSGYFGAERIARRGHA